MRLNDASVNVGGIGGVAEVARLPTDGGGSRLVGGGVVERVNVPSIAASLDREGNVDTFHYAKPKRETPELLRFPLRGESTK